MIFEIEFNTDEEKEFIISENKEKYLTSIKYIESGNFLVFSDVPTIEILQQEQGEKISILEAENKAIKQELALTQDAVNEMLFMMMNIKGE